MTKSTDSTVVVRINEDIVAASLLSLYGEKNKKLEIQDKVTNIEFESIVTSIKKY